MNQNAITNPLADLLAGRNLDQMSSVDIEALFGPLEVKTNDSAAAVIEAEARARDAVSTGAASISVDGISHARMVHEFCGVAQATLAAALDAAKQRERQARKEAKLAEISEYLDARNKAARKLEKALADVGAAFQLIVANGKAAVRSCNSKLEASVIAEFQNDVLRHLVEMELWRNTGGVWAYTRIPYPFDGSFPSLPQLVANAGSDLITEIEIRD
jgi:hypothetical protein